MICGFWNCWRRSRWQLRWCLWCAGSVSTLGDPASIVGLCDLCVSKCVALAQGGPRRKFAKAIHDGSLFFTCVQVRSVVQDTVVVISDSALVIFASARTRT